MTIVCFLNFLTNGKPSESIMKLWLKKNSGDAFYCREQWIRFYQETRLSLVAGPLTLKRRFLKENLGSVNLSFQKL